MLSQSISTCAPVYRIRTHWMNGRIASLEKESTIPPKVCTVDVSPSFLNWGLWPCSRLLQVKEKEIFKFLRVTRHWLWSDSNFRRSICHHGLLLGGGSFRGQVINGLLAQVHLTLGSVGSWTHLVVISPVAECIIGIDLFSDWKHPHIDYITTGMRATMLQNPLWKPLGLVVYSIKSKPKAIFHLWKYFRD